MTRMMSLTMAGLASLGVLVASASADSFGISFHYSHHPRVCRVYPVSSYTCYTWTPLVTYREYAPVVVYDPCPDVVVYDPAPPVVVYRETPVYVYRPYTCRTVYHRVVYRPARTVYVVDRPHVVRYAPGRSIGASFYYRGYREAGGRSFYYAGRHRAFGGRFYWDR
jgi:hypothetical protein